MKRTIVFGFCTLMLAQSCMCCALASRSLLFVGMAGVVTGTALVATSAMGFWVLRCERRRDEREAAERAARAAAWAAEMAKAAAKAAKQLPGA